MRVDERGSSQVRAEAAAGGGFADALRRARGDGADPRGRAAARLERRRPAPPAGADPRGEAGSGERASLVPGAEATRVAASHDPPPAPELGALARALPVAVAAAVARQGAPLSLSFGRSLDVELRAGTAGVELLLRPEPRLARVVEAELPKILAAMRVRGVEVARAEVRPRGGAARRAR